ncbi:MAG: DUF2510 domain-containing protein [Propionibacteriales bacterium]|nr:DUF2510 domain-containing protein [Propionibacteriales bacterium]
MSSPGWYPDPAKVPNRLRYWDGQTWTTQVRDDLAPGGGAPGGPTGPGSPGSPGGGKGWLWALLAGLLVVALVVVLVIINPFKPTLPDGPVATYSPTISSWNETETPTPTPSVPSPSITQLRCDQEGPVRDVPATVTNHRVKVGPMSMPVPDGWEGPQAMNAVLYLVAAQGYTIDIEPRWFNQMVIGPTNFADPSTSLETQARTIVACLSGTDVMDRYRAPDKLEITKTSVSGHPAVQADASYSWSDTDIQSKGSKIRVVVVQTADGPYAFFGEATQERADILALMDTLTANLAIT